MIYHTVAPLVVKHTAPEGVFSGYASTYDVDLVKDQIVPGAFKNTLTHWQERKKRWPYLFYGHDLSEPLGVFTDLIEDKKGLFAKGKFLFDFPPAREAFLAVQKGLTGLSIGFHVVRSHKDKGIRKITELSLEEISCVTFPCNPEAKIHEYKNYDHETQAVCQKLKKLSNLFRHS